ncbi:MAG: hypothetical protein VKM92_05505 [Cyanobacteriota bacterium]|nr:hypothetical protein [Cyanobacteriota bacterium]
MPQVSFEINRVEKLPGGNRAEQLQRAFITRLDRENSAQLISRARSIYWRFLSTGGIASPPPRGVVLQGTWGRVVFSWPTLLPEELFVPGDWITGPGPFSGRPLRSRTRPQPACPIQQP